ncbi:MAG: DUF3857 domain-containing protein [Crocinitomicaceae bacterium]|nr:DUF3857 and transglutaminase domain-containing protein [Flavobacteriales bacterium]NQZ35025.1 DUF3857 domain-containing protein [Crocinitomicaceae bacterium]
MKKHSLEITITKSGDKLKIITKETSQKEVLDISKLRSGDLKEYAHWNKAFESRPDFNAFTDNSNVENARKKKVRVESITLEDYSSRGVFYDGTKLFTLTFPAVESGSILTCVTTKEEYESHLLPPFYFDNYLDCESAELTVRFPNDIAIGFLNFNHETSDQIEFEEINKDKETIYRWRAKNVKALTYESDARGRSCHSPHTIIHIKSYTLLNGDVKNVLRDKNDLFTWYSELINDQKLGDHQLAIVDSLNAISNSKNELAENIFNWVQHNIKYIAYEDGFGGFIPRTPESVIHNRFGDCKDMALLTKTMMNAANLDCYIAWVGTRSKCYTYDNCPTPLVDNHMIAAYPNGDELIFLDPTSSYSVFGRPSSFIQGKQAMVRTSEGTFEIIEVPIIDGKDNLDHTIINARIDGNDLLGKGENMLSGFGKESYENAYDHRLTGKEQLFTDYISLGNEGLKVENLTQNNLDSNKGSINSKFDFSLKNYLSKFENETYINPFIKDVIDFNLKDRELLLDLDYKSKTLVEVSIEIPEGSKLDVPFESETISENGLVLEITTSIEENIFYLTYSFTCDRLEIEPKDFEAIRSTLKKMNKKLNKQITLTHEN